jgi:hypothetical protein
MVNALLIIDLMKSVACDINLGRKIQFATSIVRQTLQKKPKGVHKTLKDGSPVLSSLRNVAMKTELIHWVNHVTPCPCFIKCHIGHE